MGHKNALIAAVQSALVSAFHIPEGDRDVVLGLHPEERRIVPAGHADRDTRIEIIGIAARSLEAERALYREVVHTRERAGAPRMESRIVVIDPPPNTWVIKGGIPASEAGLGLKIEV